MKVAEDELEGELRRLYTDEHWTEKEISDLWTEKEISDLKGRPYHQVKVGRLRRKLGIPTVGKTKRMEGSLPSLTEHQTQLLTGSLLGDGTMSAPSGKTARFLEGHSLKQRGYVDWKGGILGPFISSYHEGSKRKGGKVYRSWNFLTKTCTQLRPFYDLFYPKPARVRVFPPDLYKRMTPFVLAVWFMDDGSCSKFHPSLTFGLDDMSLKRATRALRVLGLKPVIYEDPRDGCKSIGFPSQSDLFFELVGPHMPACMAAKLPKPSKRRDVDRRAKALTPRMARDLYSGGLTLHKIGELYGGLSPSTVSRRLGTLGPSKKMGRPRKSYSLLAATVSLKNYDPLEWAGRGPIERQEFESEIVGILLKTKFPVPAPLAGAEARNSFEKLLHKEVSLDGKKEIRPASLYGLDLLRPHFPNRHRARYYTSKVSSYEAWHLESELLGAVQRQLKWGDPATPQGILRFLNMRHRTPSLFKPIVAKYICQTYGRVGGLMWDPCAGYGGRLLGCLASGMDYVATDVEPETVRGNKALAASLGLSSRVVIEQCPAESFDAPKVDLVFTSPPYFDRERYAGGEQSWRSYSTLDSWREGFLSPVLRSAFAALHDGGVCAINIADLRKGRGKYLLVDLTIQSALGAGFSHEDTIYMPLSRLGKSTEDAREPILVFRRGRALKT